jgi:hypothetical protein
MKTSYFEKIYRKAIRTSDIELLGAVSYIKLLSNKKGEIDPLEERAFYQSRKIILEEMASNLRTQRKNLETQKKRLNKKLSRLSEYSPTKKDETLPLFENQPTTRNDSAPDPSKKQPAPEEEIPF